MMANAFKGFSTAILCTLIALLAPSGAVYAEAEAHHEPVKKHKRGKKGPKYLYGHESYSGEHGKGHGRHGKKGGKGASVVIVDGKGKGRGRAATIMGAMKRVRPGGTVVVMALPQHAWAGFDHHYKESIRINKPVALIGDGAGRASDIKRPVIAPEDDRHCVTIATTGKVIIRDIDWKVSEGDAKTGRAPCVVGRRGRIELENVFIAGREKAPAILFSPNVTEALIRKNEIAHSSHGVLIETGPERRGRRFDLNRTYRIEVNDIYGNDVGISVRGRRYRYLPEHLVQVSIFDNTIVENGHSYSGRGYADYDSFDGEDGDTEPLDDEGEPANGKGETGEKAYDRDDDAAATYDGGPVNGFDANGAKAAIVLEGLVGARVQRNDIIQNGQYGIILRETGGIFEDNRIANNDGGGILVESPPLNDNRDVRPTFSGNTFMFNGQLDVSGYAIELGYDGRIELDVNQFRDNGCGCVGPSDAVIDTGAVNGRGTEVAERCLYQPHSDKDWEKHLRAKDKGRKTKLKLRCNGNGRPVR